MGHDLRLEVKISNFLTRKQRDFPDLFFEQDVDMIDIENTFDPRKIHVVYS